jgi:hypothetical protein
MFDKEKHHNNLFHSKKEGGRYITRSIHESKRFEYLHFKTKTTAKQQKEEYA